MSTPPPAGQGVVVVGGANVDLRARSTERAVGATSNPGTATFSAGGVGRNVAENLARLGTPVQLVAAVGRDDLGDRLLGETAAAGVGVEHVVRTPLPTGTYTAVLDSDGELVVAVSDMAATDVLTADDVRRATDAVTAAALVVLDGNLAVPCLAACLDLAAGAGTPVVLDPVSVPKARRLAPLLGEGRRLLAVTPNLAELGALLEMPVSGDDALHAAVDMLHRRGAEHVWVRLAGEGSILATRGETLRLAPVPGPVVDVTGAGDAMLAAFVHSLLAGSTPAHAARFGHAAAALTVAVPQTVRPDLTETLVEQALAASPRIGT